MLRVERIISLRSLLQEHVRLLCLGLVVWGEGGVKERGRLCPEYFTPPLSQVRGQEVAAQIYTKA